MKLTKLETVSELIMGQAPPGKDCNKEGIGIPFVKVGQFSEVYPIINEWTNKPLKLAKSTDILVCVVGATSGKINLGIDCAIGRSVAAIRPKINELNQSYLYHFLSTWTQRLRSGSQGSAQGVITRRMLSNLKIPIPPLEEQKRIAAILDKADRIRRKRQEAIQLTEELARSLFLDMFGDPVTNPKGWDMKPLGKLCTIVRGGSPRPINDYLDGSIPWIKIGDATEGDDIYIHKTAQTIKSEGVKNSRYLEPGALIFANCGVSLGFARILRIGGCIHDGWLAFSDLDPSIDQIFLLKSLNQITQYFRAIAPAGTQPNLNTTIMKNHNIPLPPIALQEKFVDAIQIFISSKQKYSHALQQSENLFNSLLQRAFRGDL